MAFPRQQNTDAIIQEKKMFGRKLKLYKVIQTSLPSEPEIKKIFYVYAPDLNPVSGIRRRPPQNFSEGGAFFLFNIINLRLVDSNFQKANTVTNSKDELIKMCSIFNV